ncbi:MAG: hypothetical protein JRJ75_15250 [Deltaproteobacteria bacterium]|nr:hypothetical protein [Deltaproteobacteria bacterium]
MTEQLMELDYWAGEEGTEGDSLVTLKLLTRNTRLVEARTAKGLNQVEAAHQAGIAVYRFQEIERLRRLPREEDKAKIAASLEKPIDYLFPDVLMKAIEEGVFQRRDAALAEPEIISLTEARRLRLTYDGEAEIIKQIEGHLLSEQIDSVLDTLSPREAEILRLRFGLKDGHSRTMEEVGWIFNLTKARIGQIETKALRKLRYPARTQLLKDYLD